MQQTILLSLEKLPYSFQVFFCAECTARIHYNHLYLTHLIWPDRSDPWLKKDQPYVFQNNKTNMKPQRIKHPLPPTPRDRKRSRHLTNWWIRAADLNVFVCISSFSFLFSSVILITSWYYYVEKIENNWTRLGSKSRQNYQFLFAEISKSLREKKKKKKRGKRLTHINV